MKVELAIGQDTKMAALTNDYLVENHVCPLHNHDYLDQTHEISNDYSINPPPTQPIS